MKPVSLDRTLRYQYCPPKRKKLSRKAEKATIELFKAQVAESGQGHVKRLQLQQEINEWKEMKRLEDGGWRLEDEGWRM